MMVYFNAIFARKHGEKEPYQVVAGPLLEVESKYEELIGAKSQEWRDEHAELVYYRRGEKHAYHAFESKKSRLTQEAVRAHMAHEQASAALARAHEQHEKTGKALLELSDEHRELLAAHLESKATEVGNA